MTLMISELGLGPLTERELQVAKRVAMLMSEKDMEFTRKAIEEQHRTSYLQGWADGFKIGAVEPSESEI